MNNEQLRASHGEFFEAWYESLHRVFEHRRLRDVTDDPALPPSA